MFFRTFNWYQSQVYTCQHNRHVERIIASFGNDKIDQACSFIGPPLFCGSHSARWKKRKQIFIMDHDYELREIISKGNFVPTMKEGDEIVLKLILTFTQEETEKVVTNCRALNILFCELYSNEFDHVSTCDATKEVLDTLETTFEGTTQVLESKISLYVYHYELCKTQNPLRKCI